MVGRKNCPATVERLTYTGQFEAKRRLHCRLPVGHSGPHRTGILKRFGIVEWTGDGKFIEPAKKSRPRRGGAPEEPQLEAVSDFEESPKRKFKPTTQTKLP